ncbi:hypothetical protein CERZMDRAFT_100465 [Cercospora zeae-maydis SCOH1-5]|uniref:Uncharacterized protein n=1 Tax=Cercospora zeae-maydis SCOH1-5 TaxID=717836 RepID=A0A6A6F7L2_9PEZI|nr:hypothetical protein CERZMDRAFT_100465 [Cercospora zeae-maydis SCOH1-5]
MAGHHVVVVTTRDRTVNLVNGPFSKSNLIIVSLFRSLSLRKNEAPLHHFVSRNMTKALDRWPRQLGARKQQLKDAMKRHWHSREVSLPDISQQMPSTNSPFDLSVLNTKCSQRRVGV